VFIARILTQLVRYPDIERKSTSHHSVKAITGARRNGTVTSEPAASAAINIFTGKRTPTITDGTAAVHHDTNPFWYKGIDNRTGPILAINLFGL